MDKKTQSSYSNTLDEFYKACIDADIDEESKIDISTSSPENTKSLAWKKAEDVMKGSFSEMHSRLKEVNKGLHNNNKISELIIELITVETVRQILNGKIKDLDGNEALINIHPSVAKSHWDKLKPGTVLVLKNVTVFSPSDDTHCLIILKDNIMHIFPNN